MRPLGPLEVAMLAADRWNPLNIGALVILRPPLRRGADYLASAFAAASGQGPPADPLLLRHPHRGMDTLGSWVWCSDHEFDPTRHLVRVTLPPGSGRDGLWRLVGDLHARPLDTSSPMWRTYVIDGFDEHLFALYFKAHHSVVDGVVGMRQVTETFASDPAVQGLPVFRTERSAPSTDVVETPHDRGQRVTGAMAAFGGIGCQVLADAMAISRSILAGDLQASPLAAPLTAFNRRVGRRRVAAGASCSRDRIDAVKHTAGVTQGDVLTAVIAGALRRWLRETASLPSSTLVAICPISTRTDGDPSSTSRGNMFGVWLCPLGTDLPDDAQRLRRIHRSMRSAKRLVGDRGATASMVAAGPSIASTVLPPLLSMIPRWRTGYNLPISHVRGPSTPRYWNGALVEHVFPVSAVFDGQGVNVTTCSYADHVDFGFVAGTDGAADLGRLATLIEPSMKGLESALGPTPGPSLARIVT